MDGKSEKIADLAGMFEDMDIIVIEEILELCKGQVNTAADILLKMKEESTPKSPPVLPSVEKKDSVLSDNFLELDDTEAAEEQVKKEVKEVAKEDYENEAVYQADVQRAIRMSINEGNKNGSAHKKLKIKDKIKNLFKKKKVEVEVKVKGKELQNKQSNRKILENKENTLDEEVIQFVFGKNQLIRGENYSDI